MRATKNPVVKRIGAYADGRSSADRQYAHPRSPFVDDDQSADLDLGFEPGKRRQNDLDELRAEDVLSTELDYAGSGRVACGEQQSHLAGDQR
jgi:hypothetical protein